jgi:hypothetical protein
MGAVGQLMLTNEKTGKFVLGTRPSVTDFFIAGSLQAARTVNEGVFERMVGYPGYTEDYEACLPYTEKDVWKQDQRSVARHGFNSCETMFLTLTP